MVIRSVPEAVSLILGRTKWPDITTLHRTKQVNLFGVFQKLVPLAILMKGLLVELVTRCTEGSIPACSALKVWPWTSVLNSLVGQSISWTNQFFMKKFSCLVIKLVCFLTICINSCNERVSSLKAIHHGHSHKILEIFIVMTFFLLRFQGLHCNKQIELGMHDMVAESASIPFAQTSTYLKSHSQ